MRESQMWPKLRDRLRVGRRTRLTRIENISAEGTPDISCKIEGVPHFWIESKWSEPSVRGTSKLLTGHKLTVEQENFHIGEHRAGGVSWVWVQCGSAHYLFQGILAPRINTMTREEAETWRISMTDMVQKLLSC